MKNLDLRLFKEYDTNLVGRGFTLAQDEKVEILTQTHNSITATVKGSNSYKVDIKLEGKTPKLFSCNCPYIEKMCKHVVAVLVVVDDL